MAQQCNLISPVFTPEELQKLTREIGAGYSDRVGVNLHEDHNLPRRGEVLAIVARLLEVIFPGFDDAPRHRGALHTETAELLDELCPALFDQISRAVRFGCRESDCGNCNAVERSTAAVRALLLALLPPLVLLVLGRAPLWTQWIYRALTFLVISCPCALVISIPLSFFAGIGGASKAGILVKGSNFLETLSKTGIVVFDKTGTLTRGVFVVSGIHHNTMDEAELLEYAALAESASSHPISLSLQKAYGGLVDHSRVSDVHEMGGGGVTALVDGHQVACGNDKLMRSLGIEAMPCHSIGTIVHVAFDGAYAGHIVISDVEKPGAKEAVRKLRKAGVGRIVMLTGDSARVADQVARDLGIDEVHSELLPGDKVDAVEDLIAHKDTKASLAFVGDGINDAPVLSRADIGIAMGAMGSDAAIEAADVVLMDDDPMKIAKAIRISRKCLAIVYENIVFAIGVKLICLALGALGIANMWLAIFADVGVMVIAVLNAIRAMFVRKL